MRYILEIMVGSLAVVAVSSISMEAEPLLLADAADAACMAFTKETLEPSAVYLPPGVTGNCIDSGKRCWLQYVPETRSSTGALPLLVSLHGGGSCAEYRMAYDNARKQGWIVVWPQAAGMTWKAAGMGIMSSWNGDGECCGPQAINDAVDDVAFVRQVIINVIANVKNPNTVDTTKIYMTGHSMGCMLAHRFLTKHSDLIAAMSCTSHTISKNTIPASSTVTPTPVLVIHGFVDKDVEFAGRSGEPPTPTDPITSAPWGPGYPYAQTSALSSIKEIASMMNCSEISQTPDDPSTWPTSLESIYTFNGTGCLQNPNFDRSIVSVSLLVLPKCGHDAYQGQGAPGPVCTFPTTEAQYNFFRNGPKQGDAPKLGEMVPQETFTAPTESEAGELAVIVGGAVLCTLVIVYCLKQKFARDASGTEVRETEITNSFQHA